MPRKLSLRNRLFLVVLPLLAVFVACNYAIIIGHERQILEDETEKRAFAVARLLAASSTNILATPHSGSFELQWTVEQARSLGDLQALEIVDAQGRVVAGWVRTSGDAVRDRAHQRTLDHLVMSAMQENDEKRLLRPDGANVVEVVKPIVATERVLGAVRVDVTPGGFERSHGALPHLARGPLHPAPAGSPGLHGRRGAVVHRPRATPRLGCPCHRRGRPGAQGRGPQRGRDRDPRARPQRHVQPGCVP